MASVCPREAPASIADAARALGRLQATAAFTLSDVGEENELGK